MAYSSPSMAIRANLDRVVQLRSRAAAEGEAEAVGAIKRLQALRFAGSYADLTGLPDSRAAVHFFLQELYGAHDFSERDEQFGRIAGALERLFPEAVAQLAVDLTEVHALTEVLDHQLARHWLARPESLPAAQRYLEAWRLSGERGDRERQLTVVRHMGTELTRLTRIRSLRMGLRMMRRPAHAAGLEALQHFLEAGFDAFAELQSPELFLQTIAERESQWLDRLFVGSPEVVCPQLDNAWAVGLAALDQATTMRR
jgi:hypothetical protein